MAARRDTTVVDLNARRGAANPATPPIPGIDSGESIEIVCANPRCDERFRPKRGAGKPQRYHSPDCRKSAVRDKKALQSQLSTLEGQVAQMRAQLVAYGDGDIDGDVDGGSTTTESGPSDQEWAQAREAVAAASAVVRYLANDPSPAAQDLVALLKGVEPVIRRRD